MLGPAPGGLGSCRPRERRALAGHGWHMGATCWTDAVRSVSGTWKPRVRCRQICERHTETAG